jgi:hypothetical protein
MVRVLRIARQVQLLAALLPFLPLLAEVREQAALLLLQVAILVQVQAAQLRFVAVLPALLV